MVPDVIWAELALSVGCRGPVGEKKELRKRGSIGQGTVWDAPSGTRRLGTHGLGSLATPGSVSRANRLCSSEGVGLYVGGIHGHDDMFRSYRAVASRLVMNGFHIHFGVSIFLALKRAYLPFSTRDQEADAESVIL